MSFLKIIDPEKRDFIVKEFIETKRNIQRDAIDDKLGNIGLQRELTKLYRPITDSQAGLATQLSSIKEASDATTTALKALPSTLNAITFPHQYPPIQLSDEEEYEDAPEGIMEIGNIASKYLQKYTADKKVVDTTFGIHGKEGKLYIGKLPIAIRGNDITIGEDKTYIGTEGIWELITMQNPNKSIYDSEDLDNYSEIMINTHAIQQSDNPNKPKSSRSDKYRELIKPIWEKRSYVGPVARISPSSRGNSPIPKPRSVTILPPVKKGKGVILPIPSDPNALVERLALLMSAFKAGNTGVADEAVAICDELLRQEALDRNGYKTFMKQLARI